MTETARGRDWIAVHVFYASNANPLLVECVEPLVRTLRERGLLARHFFIKYWLEGPHVRIRLLPAASADPAVIRTELEAALSQFLQRRPALYEADTAGMDELYRRMYIAEYGEQRWAAEYGETGMPYRANNSFDYFPYEPEYDRYGGPAGIELSEWHFEKSSDIVLRLLATTNVHVRTVLLGLAVQLNVALCFEFLRDPHKVASFLAEYRTFWETNYQENSEDYHDNFDKSYDRMATELVARVSEIRDRVTATEIDLTALEAEWLGHCRELRASAADLAERGELVFARGPVRDVDSALSILLSSYLHMTNNRLGVSILDEVYLSYVTRLAVLESAATAGVT